MCSWHAGLRTGEEPHLLQVPERSQLSNPVSFRGDGCTAARGSSGPYGEHLGCGWRQRASLNIPRLVCVGSRLEGIGKGFTSESFSSVHCFGTGFWAGKAADFTSARGKEGMEEHWDRHPGVLRNSTLHHPRKALQRVARGFHVPFSEAILLFREAGVIGRFCTGRDVLVQFKGHLYENLRAHEQLWLLRR